MNQSKQLSNPFSTGGGGHLFEAHVQASFIVLMLTGGYSPCLPCWPIVKIKQQGRIDGYETDDLIVFVEHPQNKEERKILCQVKHNINLTKNDGTFKEVIHAAWNDFNNAKLFTREKDVIALITGGLNKTDEHNFRFLLEQARHTEDYDNFIMRVEEAKFSPSKSTEKLQALRAHIISANNGNDVSDEIFYSFLKHFHLLGYDLGHEYGVVLSLLHSHMSQFEIEQPQHIWSRIVGFAESSNQHSGVIQYNNLPEDITDFFKDNKTKKKIPSELIDKSRQSINEIDLNQHEDATYLALLVLVGSWSDKNESDTQLISELIGLPYNEWIKKAQNILALPNNPLSIKNNIWHISDKIKLWNQLASRIIDRNLDTFKKLALSVLQEKDPMFELPPDQRYAASIYGKEMQFSPSLRKGIVEGLAILATQSETCTTLSLNKAKNVCDEVIYTLLQDADWELWGSLDQLLPTLAESAPEKFLDAVDKALINDRCLFDELFAQEVSGFTGGNYITGLLWALEALAWDKEYLSRACYYLAGLAERDPGGTWANRPSNSLKDILLPWLPHTVADFKERKIAIKAIRNDFPNVAWNLIIALWLNQYLISTGTYEPKWRNAILADWDKKITPAQYQQETLFYASLAISLSENHLDRIIKVIENIDYLSEDLLDSFLNKIIISYFSDIDKRNIWEKLSEYFFQYQREQSDTLSNEILEKLKEIIGMFQPQDIQDQYRHLFTEYDYSLYEKPGGDWDEEQKKLRAKREKAIWISIKKRGGKGIIHFSEIVPSVMQLATILGEMESITIESDFFPSLLNDGNTNHKQLVDIYIRSRPHIKGWGWVDQIDKNNWTDEEKTQFLLALPFVKETWELVSSWLSENEKLYWKAVQSNGCRKDCNYSFAIDKLIKYGRPFHAIHCLSDMLYSHNQFLRVDLCVYVLKLAVDSKEPSKGINIDAIRNVISFIQNDSSVNKDDLLDIELRYISLFNKYQYQNNFFPKAVEKEMASDPKFFCKLIQYVYYSENDVDRLGLNKKDKEKIFSIFHLLNNWRIIPGVQSDNTFDSEKFSLWFDKVKEICTTSGHWKNASYCIGQVLIYSPPDPDGLWIHKKIAAVLNERTAENIRSGYSTRIYNSRGVHSIDPTGQPERELAEKYQAQAKALEENGFINFATELKKMANRYENEAERIIEEYSKGDE